MTQTGPMLVMYAIIALMYGCAEHYKPGDFSPDEVTGVDNFVKTHIPAKK